MAACGSGGICTSSCMSTCSGSCIIWCSGACSANCATTCQGGCSNQCGGRCIGRCYGSCYDTCRGGCNDNCNDSCSGGCRGGCSSCSGSCDSCSGTCRGSCKGGCGGGCKGTCTSCSGTCKEQCVETCKGRCDNTCQNYCNSGCANGSMTDAYTSITTFNWQRPNGVVMNDLRGLLLHELDRFGKALSHANKDVTDAGKEIIYGTSITDNAGFEVNENIKLLEDLSSTVLSAKSLSRDEITNCIEYLKASYTSIIGVPHSDTGGATKKTRREDGTKITETSYNPW